MYSLSEDCRDLTSPGVEHPFEGLSPLYKESLELSLGTCTLRLLLDSLPDVSAAPNLQLSRNLPAPLLRDGVAGELDELRSTSGNPFPTELQLLFKAAKS